LKKPTICPLGILWVYCLKTLKKLSICLLGMTPSAPSVIGVVLRRNSRPIITNVLSRWRVGVLRVWEEGRRVSLERGRQPFGELGEVLEKAVEGWVKSEEWRGAHRYPVWYISSLGRAQKRGQDNGQVHGPCLYLFDNETRLQIVRKRYK